MVQVEDLHQIRRELDRFLQGFDACIKTAPSRVHLRTYVDGQISNLPRKSVEPIALEAGIAPRTLQEFLSIHRWDEAALKRRVQKVVQIDHEDENAIAAVDETSFVKKGDQTAGVQRQYCGSTGKIDNCVVTVHLGYVSGDFHTLIDSDLYLPDENWHQNRKRCEKAGIPEDVVYRAKWQMALDQVTSAVEGGLCLRYLTADETYGKSISFRDGVADLGLTYVVEVSCSLTGWIQRPDVVPAKTNVSGRGRPATRIRLSKDAKDPERVDQIALRKSLTWQAFHIKNTGKGPVVWEVCSTRFYHWEDGLPSKVCKLIIARNVLTGEIKYFLSNAVRNIPLEILLQVAFSRWHIERIFQDGKGQVGLGHFEMRRYRPLIRHLILSMVSFLFLAKQTKRLREKNPWWSLRQVRLGVEAQLDPSLSHPQRFQRLEKLAHKIQYWQTQAKKAMRAHTKIRRQKLRALGFYVSKLPKCFHLL